MVKTNKKLELVGTREDGIIAHIRTAINLELLLWIKEVGRNRKQRLLPVTYLILSEEMKIKA